MNIKTCFAFLLAVACHASLAQEKDDDEKKALEVCQVLARQINKSDRVGIRQEGMERLGTWRAACAERPPTGRGTVTALCEGKRVTDQGEEGIFFWEKSEGRKRNTGYFLCPR